MHKIVKIGVKPLIETPILPNHITTLRLITGVSAAFCFSLDESDYTTIGAVIFVLSVLLDRADGILARLTGKISSFGHKYDLTADTISNASVFIGIGVGLRNSQLGDLAIPLGLLAGLAITAVLFLVMKIEVRKGYRAAEIRISTGFDPDDAMLLVPVALLLNLDVELIIAAATGGSIFAIFFYFKVKHLLRS